MSDRDQIVLVGRTDAEFDTTSDAVNAEVEWADVPASERREAKVQLFLLFESPEDRDRLVEEEGIRVDGKTKTTWEADWPPNAEGAQLGFGI